MAVNDLNKFTQQESIRTPSRSSVTSKPINDNDFNKLNGSTDVRSLSRSSVTPRPIYESSLSKSLSRASLYSRLSNSSTRSIHSEMNKYYPEPTMSERSFYSIKGLEQALRNKIQSPNIILDLLRLLEADQMRTPVPQESLSTVSVSERVASPYRPAATTQAPITIKFIEKAAPSSDEVVEQAAKTLVDVLSHTPVDLEKSKSMTSLRSILSRMSTTSISSSRSTLLDDSLTESDIEFEHAEAKKTALRKNLIEQELAKLKQRNAIKEEEEEDEEDSETDSETGSESEYEEDELVCVPYYEVCVPPPPPVIQYVPIVTYMPVAYPPC